MAEHHQFASRRPHSSLNALFNVISAFSILMIAGLCVLIVLVQDRNAIESSKKLVRSALDSAGGEIAILNKEYAYWDQAVTRVVDEQDADWVADEFGGYVYETGGIDRTLIIDGANDLLFHVDGDELVDADEGASRIEGLAKLVAEARMTPDNTEPTAVVGFTRIEGEVYQTSAVRMTTYTETDDLTTDHIMVFARLIDTDLVEQLERASLVKDLHIGGLAAAGGEAGIELPVAGSSEPLRLFWKPDQPGSAMIPWLTAGLFGVVAIMLVAGVIFNRRLLNQARQLTIARELAEQANQQKTDMLSSISHELRTPLNAIIGFSEMMQKQFLGPVGNSRYLEYAGDIKGSGEHLLSLVNGLLDLSKIEAGKFDLICIAMPLDNVTRQCLSMVEYLAVDRGIDARFDVDEGVGPVSADERVVTQILVNLLSNALKFTPEGGQVVGTVWRVDDDTVRVAVADNGVGIAPDDLEQVMEPFYQAETKSTASQRGTGLGLTVSRKLAELMNGSLTIESELGQGTTVTLTLPSANRDNDGKTSVASTFAA